MTIFVYDNEGEDEMGVKLFIIDVNVKTFL